MGSEQPAGLRVAVTQCEPCWLDLQGGVRKTCDLIQEASHNGARLVAFPEVWIPGYPAWIWLVLLFLLSVETVLERAEVD
jgi:predicted amidohydrolase